MDVRVHCLPLIAGRSEINDLDDRTLEILEENVLGLQVTVDETRLVEQRKTIKQLLRKDADQCGAETSELVLLDQLVKI